MPIYEYQCQKCKAKTELLQTVDAPYPICPACGEDTMTKLVSRTSFRLKGTGWYQTDYAGKDYQGYETEGEGDEGSA